MVTNPWVNRITALVVLLAIYAAGYAGGRDAATMASRASTILACHGEDDGTAWLLAWQSLKPPSQKRIALSECKKNCKPVKNFNGGKPSR
jgi:hypothetical protein